MADQFDASLESELYSVLEGPEPTAKPQTIQEQLLALMTLDVPEKTAMRALALYKESAYERIVANPWVLAHVFHLQWRQADKVSKALKRAKNDAQRIGSAVFVELLNVARNGHCFEHVHTITHAAAVRTGLTQDEVKAVVANGTHGYPIEVDGQRLWLRWLLHDELQISHCVRTLVNEGSYGARPAFSETAIAALNAEQKEALGLMCTAPICVLTGGPGTGKTHTQKLVLDALPPTVRVGLCAPTGKAARRMTEMTGRPAFTIHRLLGYNPAFGFEFGEYNPLRYDLVICDEASMLDVRLAAKLLRAIDQHATRIVFVGDVDQLPPVGPGAFLKDLIASKSVPVVRLTQLYRQAEKSWVCRNAPKVISGKGKVELEDVEDFEYWDVTDIESAHAVGDVVKDLVGKLRNDGRAWDEFVVLTPMRKQGAPLATSHLNPLLQRAFNGSTHGDTLPFGDCLLRVHDRVIQTHNNYELNVLNGDIGTVKQIAAGRARAEQGALIDFDGREVVYPLSDFKDLQLGYAMTIHRAQGSQWPVVVVVCHSAHNFMLTRKLLYTAITRAEKQLFIIGDSKGLSRALQTIKDDVRKTALRGRLETVAINAGVGG